MNVFNVKVFLEIVITKNLKMRFQPIEMLKFSQTWLSLGEKMIEAICAKKTSLGVNHNQPNASLRRMMFDATGLLLGNDSKCLNCNQKLKCNLKSHETVKFVSIPPLFLSHSTSQKYNHRQHRINYYIRLKTKQKIPIVCTFTDVYFPTKFISRLKC